MNHSAVLVLVWGDPPRVLAVRKSCSADTHWSCDIALPGGHIEGGEDPVEAALREAWEEAWVHPGMVRVVGVLPPERTLSGGNLIHPVLAEPRGPLCPRPASGEVDAVLWIPLGIVGGGAQTILHPRRNMVVEGYPLAGGILWGATLRILRRLYVEHSGKTLEP